MPALLDHLQNVLRQGDTLRQLQDQVGGDRESTENAINAALPLLVAALDRQAQQDADGLNKALEDDHDGSLLDNLDEVLDRAKQGGGLASAASGVFRGLSIDRKTVDGSGIVQHLVGDRLDPLVLGISKATGLPAEKTRSLLFTLAPIVMSALAKVKGDQNLDGEGVRDLLDRETTELQRAAPTKSGTPLGKLFETDGEGETVNAAEQVGGALRMLGFGKK